MNHALNGNGNGPSSLAAHAKPELTKAQVRTSASETTETQVAFQTADGIALRGMPLRIGRHSLVFELYNPADIPQVSEALGKFEITLQEQTIYAGHAVVRNVVDVGTKII